MEYVDLKGFAGFIRERNLVEESRLSYYMNWVRRFLMSEFSSSAQATKDKVECFADQLARDGSVADWQLRQALKAVSLYLDVYLPEVNGRWQGAEGGGRVTVGVLGSRGVELGAGDSRGAGE